MSNNKKYKDDDLLFIPLGGAGEIGSNVNVYHYKGQWIMVDCGSGFADEDMPGIDMLSPDVKFLHGKKVSAIVITHAHEDHVGGLPYVMKQLRYMDQFGDMACYPKIYASKFTARFLHEKLSEFGMQNKFEVELITPDSEVDLGFFKLNFVYMNHSAPDMLSVVISTDAGKIFHTADWKRDDTPPDIENMDNDYGPLSEIDKLKKLGDDGGVLAVVSDSTNIFNPGRSESESVVYDDMFKIFSTEGGMVAVPLFASNVFRIATIVKAATAAGRKVAFTGRSLNRVIKTARACNYLYDYNFIQDNDVSNHSRKELVLLCTGCQGEVLAATSKLADGNHKCISLHEGDCMMFSSKIIPGNEKRIFALFNKLACLGVRLYTEQTHKVHVSGHPNREDVKELYDLIKPKIVVPVHGYHVHMFEHVKFAKEECGVEHAIKVSDGDIIKLSDSGAECIDNVPVTFYGIDGKMLYQPQNPVITARRRLQKAGMLVIVALAYLSSNRRDKWKSDKQGRDRGNKPFFVKTLIFSPGILDRSNSKHAHIISRILEYVSKSCNNVMGGNTNPKPKNNSPMLDMEYDNDYYECAEPEFDAEMPKKKPMKHSDNPEMIKKVRNDVIRHVKDLLDDEIGKVPYIDMYIELIS